ncbi:MAG TPA: glycosyltransferase [Gemmatimonadaceae bacterium]|nr:glycosyltransferase [Gemmatimonadaceae bacterium]
MLTVLHVDTERGWRGGQRQVLWLAAGMQAAGHRAIIVARRGNELARRAVSVGVDVVPCTPRGELDVWSAWSLRREIVRLGADIVHAHTAHAAALAALARTRTRAKVVVARRVDFPLRRNIGTRLKYDRADAVIAISRDVADVVTAGGIDPHRLHIVPDGIDLSRRVAPASRETLRSLGIDEGAELVVQVAALVIHKDPLSFLRAMRLASRQRPMLRALMVGDGPLREHVQAEASRLGLDGIVRLTGFRHDADELLAAAAVATLSSVKEGLGSVLLDAMAFGIPVAATRAGGIPEVVIDGETGLLSPPGDPQAMADNVVRLLGDRALAATLTAQASERVKLFSVEKMVEGTLAVYASVLER